MQAAVVDADGLHRGAAVTEHVVCDQDHACVQEQLSLPFGLFHEYGMDCSPPTPVDSPTTVEWVCPICTATYRRRFARTGPKQP